MSELKQITDAEWKRRRNLKKQWHEEAVEEYLEAVLRRAEEAGEDHIHLQKGQILLKDGTYLETKEYIDFFEKKGYVPTPKTETERRIRIIHAQMQEEYNYSGDNHYE